MKQRLHLARGMLTDPEVLFLDEPTIGLDPIGALEIRKIIPMLAEAGKTVLLTTHYMFEADALCEQIAMINHGEIVALGAPSEIKNRLSGIRVIEVQLQRLEAGFLPDLEALPGVLRAHAAADGMLQRLSVHVRAGLDLRSGITGLVESGGVESVMEREPTLEEAYLEILNAPV
jgi:ABC-2 type transport system ATP-binding protein